MEKETNYQNSDEIINNILENKKNFDRNQKIIFLISSFVFLIALSHIITDVFFH